METHRGYYKIDISSGVLQEGTIPLTPAESTVPTDHEISDDRGLNIVPVVPTENDNPDGSNQEDEIRRQVDEKTKRSMQV